MDDLVEEELKQFESWSITFQSYKFTKDQNLIDFTGYKTTLFVPDGTVVCFNQEVSKSIRGAIDMANEKES